MAIFAGDTRIATVATNGTVHYWQRDHLGSSSVITNSMGARVQALAYFPYGDLRPELGSGFDISIIFFGVRA